jgi:hypothetical protein
MDGCLSGWIGEFAVDEWINDWMDRYLDRWVDGK